SHHLGAVGRSDGDVQEAGRHIGAQDVAGFQLDAVKVLIADVQTNHCGVRARAACSGAGTRHVGVGGKRVWRTGSTEPAYGDIIIATCWNDEPGRGVEVGAAKKEGKADVVVVVIQQLARTVVDANDRIERG